MAEYIDRNALIEHIKKDPLFDLVEQYGITGVIESFPAADAQPVKHGQWILDNPQYLVSHCSECRCFNSIGYKWKYCPNCGARMDGNKNG